MKTICITLNCDLEKDYGLPFLDNRERIHVFSPRETPTPSCVKLRVRESIELMFILADCVTWPVACDYEEVNVNGLQSNDLNSRKPADKVGNDQRIFLYAGHDYYVYFYGEFEGYLEFSDATQLDCFDATTIPDTGFCSLLVDAGDLMKLSSVETLGLRYSLVDADRMSRHSLDHFDNLRELYIGPESNARKPLRLDINGTTIRQLRIINVGVQFLKPELTRIHDCQELYIIDPDTSWADLHNLPDSAYEKGEQLTTVVIDSYDANDKEAILDFYNKTIYYTKVTCSVTLPAYLKGATTINKKQNINISFH